MLVFDQEYLAKIGTALKLFNQEKYWECHEELEDLWLEDAHNPLRNVYWAIIQVANALYHLRNQNLAGAQGQLKKAKAKLILVEKNAIDVSLLKQKISWDNFIRLVREIPDEAKESDFDSLKDFKFR